MTTVLHFMVENVRLCVYLKNVHKVLQLVRLDPVPNGSRALVGLLNLAGDSIPIYDLSMHLNLKKLIPYTLDTPIILCSHDDKKVGLVVEKIIGLATIDELSFRKYDNSNDEEADFSAVVTIDTELSLLMNLQRLISADLIGMCHE